MVRQIFSTGPNPEAAMRAEIKKRNDENLRIEQMTAARDRALLAEHGANLSRDLTSSLRIAGARGEPFTKEQFERELRHPDAAKRDLDPFTKKALEEARDRNLQEHFRQSTLSRQQIADNEASRIFSHSFQKDNAPKAPPAGRGHQVRPIS